jgi:hypothetical protein
MRCRTGQLSCHATVVFVSFRDATHMLSRDTLHSFSQGSPRAHTSTNPAPCPVAPSPLCKLTPANPCGRPASPLHVVIERSSDFGQPCLCFVLAGCFLCSSEHEGERSRHGPRSTPPFPKVGGVLTQRAEALAKRATVLAGVAPPPPCLLKLRANCPLGVAQYQRLAHMHCKRNKATLKGASHALPLQPRGL